jgi:hypothetical protein
MGKSMKVLVALALMLLFSAVGTRRCWLRMSPAGMGNRFWLAGLSQPCGCRRASG